MAGSAARTAVVTACGALVLVIGVAPAEAAAASLSPTHGPVGTVVTITGSGVKDATDVTFNGVDAGAPTPVDDTHVRATVPRGATTGAVVVTASDATTLIQAGTFTVQQPTTATIGRSAAVAVFPQKVTVRAVLRSHGARVAGQSARLQRIVIGSGDWSAVGIRKTTSSTGSVAWRFTPRRTYAYRVVFRPTAAHAGTTSPRVQVSVRPRLTLAAPPVAPILSPLHVSGVLRPVDATGPVYLLRWHDGAWHRVAKATRGRPGHYTATTSLPAVGRNSLKLVRPWHDRLLGAQSTVARVTGVNRTVRQGSVGSDVLALQRRLAALHYDVGRVNGSFGYDTLHAVIAFEKVNGMSRDGVVGPAVWTRLTAPRVPRLLHPLADKAGVEVDLTHQVLYYGVDGRIRRIIDASTGGGYTYTGSDGATHQAITPTGHFSVVYKRDGWVTAPLGTLYRPAYFNYDGYAIHGEGAVPSYPASHGCVRITVPAMDRFNAKLTIGLSVWIYRL
ncbi:MAG TPA: peptidoglycan-binding protein [Mycobacteriales bacterium]|nr:peptidoglycan-binding protein [Mycobacteriales bacterium]